MAEKGTLKRVKNDGYAQAVLVNMRARWPELIALLPSDVSNKKQELFEGDALCMLGWMGLRGRAWRGRPMAV